jgi:uncharacterized membrane protein YeiH
MNTLTPAFDLTVAILDWLGVIVFAAAGSLAAARKRLDVIGFAMFGTVTGIGGGTVRDLLLDQPVFWVVQPAYLAVCLGVAVLVYFIAPLLHALYSYLLWLDAVGLAVFAVAGADKGLLAGVHPLVAVTVGVMTATLGGILRDVLAHEPSVLLRPEIYITAAVVGSAVFVGLSTAGVSGDVAGIAGAASALFIRGGALLKGWTLPRHRSTQDR